MPGFGMVCGVTSPIIELDSYALPMQKVRSKEKPAISSFSALLVEANASAEITQFTSYWSGNCECIYVKRSHDLC